MFTVANYTINIQFALIVSHGSIISNYQQFSLIKHLNTHPFQIIIISLDVSQRVTKLSLIILLYGFFLAKTGFLKSVFSTTGLRVIFGEGSKVSFKKFPISSWKIYILIIYMHYSLYKILFKLKIYTKTHLSTRF